MPYFERSDIDGTWRIGITAEDLAWLASKRDSLASKLRGDHPAYIRYDLAHSAESYGDQPWVEMSLPGSHLRVPYVILHDYRTAPTNATWGTADVRGQFQFPSDLLDHRHAMVDRFKAEDRLPKGDSICPRVADFSRDANGNPILSIERAWYTDQVGTNLTIDYPMRVPREMPRGICRTVREWDRAQGVDAARSLPSFQASKLANTIGVSIGVTCRSRDGRIALLQRRRAKNVAVYRNMWASPFGFAMSISKELSDGAHDLRELISLDYGHEFAQELGLEHDSFSAPRAVAICRDLPRGGKPQFFFEITTDYSLEEIADKLGKSSAEYSSRVRRVDRVNPEDDGNEVSPELTCFLALIASERGPRAVGVDGATPRAIR